MSVYHAPGDSNPPAEARHLNYNASAPKNLKTRPRPLCNIFPILLGYPAALTDIDSEMISALTLRRVVTTLLRLSSTRIIILGTHVRCACVEAGGKGRRRFRKATDGGPKEVPPLFVQVILTAVGLAMRRHHHTAFEIPLKDRQITTCTKTCGRLSKIASRL